MRVGLVWTLAALAGGASAQLASMVEGIINYYRGKGASDIESILRQRRSRSCEWAQWNRCVWPSAGDGSRWRSDKYLDQLGATCQRHWFFQLVRSRYSDSLNNVFEYTKNAMSAESKAAPCGMCAYRQSCGYGGRGQCDKPFIGRRPDVVPLHVKEQICSTSRGLRKSQAEPCSMLRSVLQWNNPSAPCQIWPAVERNLRLPDLSDSFRDQLKGIEFMRCVPDSQQPSSVLRVAGSPLNGQRFANRCRCCCFPYEPKLVPRRWRRNGIRRVWLCRKMDLRNLQRLPQSPKRG